MALIARAVQTKSLLQLTKIINAASTRQGHWLPDYKPGPIPQNEEERIQASKKYNLLPQEYKPFPDDGFGLGDYPDIKSESVDAKDDFLTYDFPLLRRNYMEAVPANMVSLIPELVSTKKERVSDLRGLFYYVNFLIIGATIVYVLQLFKYTEPMLERQKISPGVTHYTFELDHDKK